MVQILLVLHYSISITNRTVDYDCRYILTCGTDGDVRIWEGIEDDDAVSHRVGDRAFAIAFKVSVYHCCY